MKPMFIPLRSEYYNAFLDGSKRDELRQYGARWNEKTCMVGRPVVLSNGYGKYHRTTGVINRFQRQRAATLGSTYKAAILKCYGTLDFDVAVVSITINREA